MFGHEDGFIFKDLFYLFGIQSDTERNRSRARERERRREKDLSSISYSTDSYNSWGQAGPGEQQEAVGATSSSSTQVAETQEHGPSSTAFPGILAESWSSWDLNCYLVWNVSVTAGGLTLCATTLNPVRMFYAATPQRINLLFSSTMGLSLHESWSGFACLLD